MKLPTICEAANRAPLSLTGVLAWGLTLGTVGMAAISAIAWGMGWL